jgi:hypothetical protein
MASAGLAAGRGASTGTAPASNGRRPAIRDGARQIGHSVTVACGTAPSAAPPAKKYLQSAE